MDNLVIVATDVGIAKRARNFAEKLHTPLAIMEKRRIGNEDRTEDLEIIGDVNGKYVLTFDDEIDTAGSLVTATRALLEHGAIEVYACATHPIFSGAAIDRLKNSAIKEVVVTDTVPLPKKKRLPMFMVLSVAPVFGEAISRIHTGQSVGTMFQ